MILQRWLIVAGIIAFGYFTYLLIPILTPFVISAFLAYLGDPIVDKLEDNKFPRTLAVIFVFFFMLIIGFCFLLIIVPLLEEQVSHLLKRLPYMLNWVQTKVLPWLSQRLNMDVMDFSIIESVRQSIVENWQTMGGIAGKFLLQVFASGQLILLWISYFLLIPVVTFYLLRDWDSLLERISALIPRKHERLITQLVRNCDAVLSEFLRGQLLVIIIQGIVYSTGLWIVGLEFALLIGLTAGLVSFVPYLGFILGLSIAGIAAFFQFHDLIQGVYILIVFGVGQILESMVLSPLLIGDRIGLHPVAVIFAVIAGSQLLGFFGMLLALPMAAIIMVLLRYFHEQYLDSTLYNA